MQTVKFYSHEYYDSSIALIINTVFHAKRVEFENRDKKSKSQAKHLHPTSRYLFEITGLLSDFGGINESHKPHPWPQTTF